MFRHSTTLRLDVSGYRQLKSSSHTCKSDQESNHQDASQLIVIDLVRAAAADEHGSFSVYALAEMRSHTFAHKINPESTC